MKILFTVDDSKLMIQMIFINKCFQINFDVKVILCTLFLQLILSTYFLFL